MTIDELIKLLRANRSGDYRKQITDVIHGIETYSLGTEVDVGTVKEEDLKKGNFKFALTNGELKLKK